MINVAILGFGVVGSGTARLLTENAEIIEKKTGEKICVKRILDLRDFPDSPFADKITHDINDILNDPEISIVAEVIGGSHPAFEFTCACFRAGKSVVSSNKEVVANFGVELTELARECGVSYLFEASVGGGIPVLRPLMNDLSANDITSVHGILNGTTNYILTQMTDYKRDFADVLADAQKKGYAEADPTADVEGIDAMRKICILGAICFGKLLDTSKISCKGITKVRLRDHEAAAECNCKIKLIGSAWKHDGKIIECVRPCFVAESNPLYSIADVFNGILACGDYTGDVMFYGRGAGAGPTASAVVSDIVDIVVSKDSPKKIFWERANDSEIYDYADYGYSRYISVDISQKDALLASGVKIEKLIVDRTECAAILAPITDRQLSDVVKKHSLNILADICVL